MPLSRTKIVISAVLLFLAIVPATAAFFIAQTALIAYEGIVATRGLGPDAPLLTQYNQGMSRVGHYSRTAITSLKIISPNFYKSEFAPGAATTLKASVEYPEGICTVITFSSSTTGTIPDGGQLTSDSVLVTIPDNTLFWIRQYYTNSEGLVGVINWNNNATMGDAYNAGVSGITDRTVSCSSVPITEPTILFAPLAIIGSTAKPSVCMLGNSIAAGTGDTANSVGDAGILARSIGPSFSYTQLGVPGEQAIDFINAGTQRRALLPYCSHVIVEYGSNDMSFGGATAAELRTNLTTIYGYPPAAAKIFETTVIPRTDSDNTAPVSAGFETQRVLFNTSLRNSSFGPNAGYFDTTSVVENSLNGGLWKTGGACTPWTDDGIHPNPCSYGVVQSSGIIDTSRIHLP